MKQVFVIASLLLLCITVTTAKPSKGKQSVLPWKMRKAYKVQAGDSTAENGSEVDDEYAQGERYPPGDDTYEAGDAPSEETYEAGDDMETYEENVREHRLGQPTTDNLTTAKPSPANATTDNLTTAKPSPANATGSPTVVKPGRNQVKMLYAVNATNAVNAMHAEIALYALRAKHAGLATNATYAVNAQKSQYAEMAQEATRATYAKSAKTAKWAFFAENAQTIVHFVPTEAYKIMHVNLAKVELESPQVHLDGDGTPWSGERSSTDVVDAENAKKALYAEDAEMAGEAVFSVNAKYAKYAKDATNTEHALRAETAASAETATYAFSATNATYAKNAKNVIIP